jgi:hypothetical protein
MIIFKKSYGGSIFSFFESKSTNEEIDDKDLFDSSEEE